MTATTPVPAPTPSSAHTDRVPAQDAPVAVNPGCRQLLQNPGFEERGGWTLQVTKDPAAYSGEQIFSGTSSVRLGLSAAARNRSSYSTGYQWLDLPNEATSITLQAQVWRSSPGASGEQDLQYLWVTVHGGLTYRVLEGRDNGQRWETITYDLTPFKGKSIRILFGVYNDGSGERTVMYVDDAMIELCEELIGK
jgi:hypothetical protein